MIRVVFDTNVFISFLLTSSETISRLFDLWVSDVIDVYYSKETLDELNRALGYPKLSRYIRTEEKNLLVEKVRTSGYLCEVKDLIRVCSDPKDDMFLNLALTAGAQYIITGDKDLLKLNGDKMIKDIVILSPSDFLRVIKK